MRRWWMQHLCEWIANQISEHVDSYSCSTGKVKDCQRKSVMKMILKAYVTYILCLEKIMINMNKLYGLFTEY